jgi:hypothetical protein
MNVPKRRHSWTTAETAAAADDVSIGNAFVIVLFTQGWLCVWIVFCPLVDLRFLSQANLHGRAPQGTRSIMSADKRKQNLASGVFLYVICSISVLIYTKCHTVYRRHWHRVTWHYVMEIYITTVPNWRSTQFYVLTTATAKKKCLLVCIFHTVQTKYPLCTLTVLFAIFKSPKAEFNLFRSHISFVELIKPEDPKLTIKERLCVLRTAIRAEWIAFSEV